MNDVDEIRHLYGQDELRPLWDELRRRFEHDAVVSAVVLKDLDDPARVAVAELLGRWEVPERIRIPLDRLNKELEPYTARQVVVTLDGPLRDLVAQRKVAATKKAELWSWLATHPLVVGRRLGVWAEEQRRVGTLEGSLDRTRELFEQALSVLAELPMPKPVDRQVLAARVLGPTHALDGQETLSRLVLSAIAAEQGVDAPVGALERRRSWRSVNVVVDEFSSTVLLAGFSPDGDGLLARLLRQVTSQGQPLAATLSQVTDPGEIVWPAGDVFVVENPSVVSAAVRHFGSSCPPLVCTSGWPAAASVTLLKQLVDSGGTLRYSGDFDPNGLAIVSWLAQRVPVQPWRMDVSTYRRALTCGRVEGECDPAGPADVPDWLADLMDELNAERVAVCQEHFLDELLRDLAAVNDL